MPFYLKCQFCLGSKLKHTFIHLRLKSSLFYEFDDRYISFLDVLDLPSSSVIKTPWDIVSVNGCVAGKKHVFLLRMPILLRP